MSAMREPRSSSAGSEYYYRRALSVRELLPAIGIGIGAGIAAFYVARVLFERTPLRPERRPAVTRPKATSVPRSALR
jgi:hypothetical protein